MIEGILTNIGNSIGIAVIDYGGGNSHCTCDDIRSTVRPTAIINVCHLNVIVSKNVVIERFAVVGVGEIVGGGA